MSKKELSKKELDDITDIEYLQKNLFKALKIPLKYHGLKEDNIIGVNKPKQR